MKMQFQCDSVVSGGGIVKVTMTADNHPRSQQEVLHLNILAWRGEFEPGEVWEMTLRKKG